MMPVKRPAWHVVSVSRHALTRASLLKSECIFCGFCQDACPVNAINLGENYEQAYYRKEDFVLDINTLLSMYEGKK